MRIEVAGIPAPQGSKRHVGGGRMVESSRAVGPWREAVRAETQRAVKLEGSFAGPVHLELTFWLPRPKGHYGTGRNAGQVRESAPCYPTSRPDVDKLARAVLDGLVDGGAFADDSEVTSLTTVKRYEGEFGHKPGCVVFIEEEWS
jgi:crossover junction endodeoxyribonuclease RusA